MLDPENVVKKGNTAVNCERQMGSIEKNTTSLERERANSMRN